MSSTNNPSLFPTPNTYDIPSPTFATPSVDNPVPEGFEGTVSSNIPSTSSGTIVPWTSTSQTYAAGAIASYLGNFYINLTGSNTGNPVSDTTDWRQVYNLSAGVGTPTAPLTSLPITYTTPDVNFPAPPVTPAGTLSGTPNATTPTTTAVYPNIPAFASASKLTAWSSSVTYVIGNLISFNLSVSAWASGTSYSKGNLVTRQVQGVAGLNTAVYMSQVNSNQGNDPALSGQGRSFLGSAESGFAPDFEFWIPVALTLVSGTTYIIGFMSTINANLNNTPSATSSDWTIVPEEDALTLTREDGPLTFPSLQYAGGTETEVWSTNNQFGTTSTSTITRADASRAVGSASLSPTSLSFSHTTTGTSTLTTKDPQANVVVPGTVEPGNGLVPLINVTSSDVTKATVAVVQSTGVITVTGVAAGSITITVTWGQLTLSLPVTLS